MPDTGPPAESAKRQLSATAYGALIVVLVMVLYHTFWWNRFMALHAGDGFFALGLWYLDGLMPYRDYFGCICPLSVFIDAGVIATLGKFYWTTRAPGVFERVSLAAVIYLWLRRLFPPAQSALAAIVTTIAGCGSFTDPLDAFQQEESWRFGKPSGNRAIVAACETLAKEYSLARTFRIALYKKDVMVFVRPR